jgi:hypothetical protein
MVKSVTLPVRLQQPLQQDRWFLDRLDPDAPHQAHIGTAAAWLEHPLLDALCEHPPGVLLLLQRMHLSQPPLRALAASGAAGGSGNSAAPTPTARGLSPGKLLLALLLKTEKLNGLSFAALWKQLPESALQALAAWRAAAQRRAAAAIAAASSSRQAQQQRLGVAATSAAAAAAAAAACSHGGDAAGASSGKHSTPSVCSTKQQQQQQQQDGTAGLPAASAAKAGKGQSTAGDASTVPGDMQQHALDAFGLVSPRARRGKHHWLAGAFPALHRVMAGRISSRRFAGRRWRPGIAGSGGDSSSSGGSCEGTKTSSNSTGSTPSGSARGSCGGGALAAALGSKLALGPAAAAAAPADSGRPEETVGEQQPRRHAPGLPWQRSSRLKQQRAQRLVAAAQEQQRAARLARYTAEFRAWTLANMMAEVSKN